MLSIFYTLDALWLFGLISAALSILAFLPYIIDTVSGRSQPQRASWFVWSFLGSMSLATQIADGATTSLWFVAVQVGGTLLIFVLSLWRGTGGLMRPTDCKVMLAACVGIGLWYITDNPVWALAIAIGVSLLGGLVTIAKAYDAPSSETLAFWAFSGVSAIFAIAAVGAWDPMKLAYPVYILVLNAGIVVAILMGREPRTDVPSTIVLAGAPAVNFAQEQLDAAQGARALPHAASRAHLDTGMRQMW